MKKFKKIFLSVLCIVLIVCISACSFFSKNQEKEKDEEKDETQEQQDPDTEQNEIETLQFPQPSIGTDGTYARSAGDLPCIGSPKVVAFVIDFLDDDISNFKYSVSDIETKLFADALSAASGPKFENESLRGYYYRSSYGKLDITGDVFHYITKEPKEAYIGTQNTGNSYADGAADLGKIMNETMEYAGAESALDWSQYDINEDGYIDGLYFILRSSISGINFVDGVGYTRAEKKISQRLIVQGQGNSLSIRLLAHETCHMFDFNDIYSGASLNPAGTGATTAMDGDAGDLPGIMKCILGWIEPKLVTKIGETPVTLASMSVKPELLVIRVNADVDTMDWFIAEYITSENNNYDLSSYGLKAGGGLRIWRVKMNSQLFMGKRGTYTYLESVYYTGFKDYFFYPGDTFTPSTKLNSDYPKSIIVSGGNATPSELAYSGVYLQDIQIKSNKANFLVNIIAAGDEILPAGINVSQKTMSLRSGDKKQLTASILPSGVTDKTVIWTSDKTMAALVDAYGFVTAVAPGTAMITAATINGKTDTCVVTVNAIPGVSWTYHNPNGNLKFMVEADLTLLSQNGPDWNYSPVTYIKITGLMNNNDLLFICEKLGAILITLDISGVTSNFPTYTFSTCSALIHVRVPANQALTHGMFWNCKSLTTLQAGDEEFEYGVINLKNYTAASYGAYAFGNCSAITKARIPANIELAQAMFIYCSSLKELQVGEAEFIENLIDLGDYTAGFLGQYIFSTCISIIKVRFPEVAALSVALFSNCKNLTELHFTGGIAPTVEMYTFSQIKTTGVVYYPTGVSGYDIGSLGLLSGWTFVETF